MSAEELIEELEVTEFTEEFFVILEQIQVRAENCDKVALAEMEAYIG